MAIEVGVDWEDIELAAGSTEPAGHTDALDTWGVWRRRIVANPNLAIVVVIVASMLLVDAALRSMGR